MCLHCLVIEAVKFSFLISNISCVWVCSQATNNSFAVILPPLETESNLLKLLTVDRSKKEGGSDGVQTDTTDNNHGTDKSDILKV